MSDRNVITPADAKRLLEEVDAKADERALLASRALLTILSGLLRTFRPSLVGALEAIDDFSHSLRGQGVDSPIWRQIKTELRYIERSESEDPTNQGK